jgi:hypothetical protein
MWWKRKEVLRREQNSSLSIHKQVTLMTELDHARNWNISATLGYENNTPDIGRDFTVYYYYCCCCCCCTLHRICILRTKAIPRPNTRQKLTWRPHITAKKIQINLKLRQMNWLIGRKSKLTTENKLPLYKAIIKPIWYYGIQVWGYAKPSNTQIIQIIQ